MFIIMNPYWGACMQINITAMNFFFQIMTNANYLILHVIEITPRTAEIKPHDMFVNFFSYSVNYSKSLPNSKGEIKTSETSTLPHKK